MVAGTSGTLVDVTARVEAAGEILVPVVAEVNCGI